MLSRYYRQNCKNSRLFSRNSTFAGESLGHHQKDTYYQIDHQVGFYYQIDSINIQSNFPTGEDPQKLEIQAPRLKIGKQVIKRWRSENRSVW